MEPAGPAPVSGSSDLGSMSLFELPVSRGARTARVAAVLALDLIMAGAGIAMILSYLSDRDAAAERTAPTVELEPPPPPEIETLEPDTVDPEEVKRAPTRRARSLSRRPKPNRPAADTTPPPDPEPAPPDPDPDPAPDPDPPVAEPAPDAAPAEDPGLIDDDLGEAERVDFAARQVRRVVESHQAQLGKCYQRAAKQTSPTQRLEGRVDIQFVIMPDGTASNVTPVANSTKSDQLADCVKTLIESWTFPSPGAEEIAFVWPFVFKAP